MGGLSPGQQPVPLPESQERTRHHERCQVHAHLTGQDRPVQRAGTNVGINHMAEVSNTTGKEDEAGGDAERIGTGSRPLAVETVEDQPGDDEVRAAVPKLAISKTR
jgi:hypothetical protein